MRKESAFTVFLLSLLFFATTEELSAQIATPPPPGVAPGNVFTYDFSAFWSSTDKTAKLPDDMVELNKTKTIRLTITEVYSNGMVIMNITSRFENETENTAKGWVNIWTGTSISAFGLIASRNLTTNNVVYYQGDYNFTINGTATRTYLFGEREAAYYTVNSTGADYVYNFKMMYFDRQTGVMLENYMEQVITASPDETRALLWKITGFDLRTIGGILDYWPVIVAAVSVVVVIIAVIVYRRKQRGKKRHRK